MEIYRKFRIFNQLLIKKKIKKLISDIFDYILLLGMCLQKSARIFLFLAALIILGGCALDDALSSTGTYIINAKINDTTLEDFSLVSSKDKIQPFFEEPVSEDPDITELILFLKDPRGMTTGYKATYSLTYSDNNNNNESKPELQQKKEEQDENITELENIKHIKKGKEIIFPVKSLDKILPLFPLPSDLPIGKYTLVFQLMGKNTVLYKYEKPFFYLAGAELSFDGIQVNLPGVADNSYIQNGTNILLDVNLTFDSRLDPYIVWYNGKKIIGEGLYSNGAGSLLWKAPEQNGFISLSAEVFPSWERTGLTGYQKRISPLVSSKEIDMHLLSKNTPNLIQWYTFEGELNDSLTKGPDKRVIVPAQKNKLKWQASNGTYGLAAGTGNAFNLPKIPLKNNEKESWQIISRFKPLSEGEVFSVQFGIDSGVNMTLNNKKSSLILTLASSSKAYSETLKLPEDEDSFITVSVKFFTQAGRLSAKMAFIKSDYDYNEPVTNPISIEADLDKEFAVVLGQQQKIPADDLQADPVQKQSFTALWDELAILNISVY